MAAPVTRPGPPSRSPTLPRLLREPGSDTSSCDIPGLRPGTSDDYLVPRPERFAGFLPQRIRSVSWKHRPLSHLTVTPGEERNPANLGGRGTRRQASGTFSPLPMTTTPFGEVVKRSWSATGSTPIRAPGGTLTFLSTMALRITAPVPTVTSLSRTAFSTRTPRSTTTPGEMTDDRTQPPEMITPAQTMESRAWPVPSSPWSTNLAGGRLGGEV